MSRVPTTANVRPVDTTRSPSPVPVSRLQHGRTHSYPPLLSTISASHASQHIAPTFSDFNDVEELSNPARVTTPQTSFQHARGTSFGHPEPVQLPMAAPLPPLPPPPPPPLRPSTPPPPPPPPPVWIPSELEPAPYTGPSGLTRYFDRYEDLLDRIEEQQENLRDVRDKLIGSRFRLRSQRQKLREVQKQTASKVGAAFDLMQRHFLTTNHKIPEEISAIFSQIDELRDTLGPQEEDYETAEQKYNLEEVQYSEKELHFIDNLHQPIPFPPAPLEPFAMQSHDDDMEGLIRFSHGPAVIELPGNSGDTTDLRSAVPQIIPSELDLPSADVTDASEFSTGSVTPHATGNVVLPIEQGENRSSHNNNTTNGIDISSPQGKWLETQKLIEDWILQSLRVSPLQQARLKELVPEDCLNQNAWWQLVERHWHATSLYGTPYHTGDTTVSGTDISEGQTRSLDRGPASVADAESTPQRQSPKSSLLPEERVVDALEPFAFPAKIKMRDLGHTPKRVTFLIRSPSAHSLSTQHTTGTRTSRSSGRDCSSMSTIDEDTSCASSAGGETIRHGYRTENKSSSIGSGQPDTSESTESRSFEHSSAPYPSDGYFAVYTNDEPVPSIGTPTKLSHTSDDSQLSSHSLDSPSQEITPEAQVPRNFLSARLQTRHPSAPFIRVKSPEPWSLPLLRLTPQLDLPNIEPSKVNHNSRLENIPFVSVSDTPQRLPGPSSMSETSIMEMYD